MGMNWKNRFRIVPKVIHVDVPADPERDRADAAINAAMTSEWAAEAVGWDEDKDAPRTPIEQPQPA